MKLFIKKTFLMVSFAVSIMIFSSCDDFLDRQEDEKLTFDKIWESRNTTRQYWLNAMNFLPNDAEDFNYSPWLGASDECSVTYDRDTRWINFGSWNASNVPYYKMDYYYKGVRECNIFMQNVDRCSDPLKDPALLAQWKIQARFARAYYYFLMMRVYGPVFLLGDEILDFSASTEKLARPRNTWEECVEYVVSEMEAVATDQTVKTVYESAEMGLVTVGTCQAVIARLRLYSARDLFNGNKMYASVKNPVTSEFPGLSGLHLFPQVNDPDKWLEAAKAAKILIDNPMYKLYRAGDGSNPYANYYGITQVEWNEELIWTTGRKSRRVMAVHTAPTSLNGTAWGGVGPTQQQVDAYAMKEGRYPITGYTKSGDPVVDGQSGYNGLTELELTTWRYPAWTGGRERDLEAPNMYKDREPRFYVSVFFSGGYWVFADNEKRTSFADKANGNKSHDYPKSGYMINRFYDHTLNSEADQWGNIVFPTFRLAEIYLNFIESVLECKKNGVTLPAGYEQKAMEIWADLRDRSGMKPITTVYAGATTEKLIELCRQERRVELAFENHRYFDTRTWMIAEQVDGGPMYGMNTKAPKIQTDDKGELTPPEFWKRVVFETRVFKPNHYLYPFLQRELDRNRLLTQNYGW